MGRGAQREESKEGRAGENSEAKPFSFRVRVGGSHLVLMFAWGWPGGCVGEQILCAHYVFGFWPLFREERGAVFLTL